MLIEQLRSNSSPRKTTFRTVWKGLQKKEFQSAMQNSPTEFTKGPSNQNMGPNDLRKIPSIYG